MKPIHQMTGTDIVNLLKTVDKKTWIKIGAAAGVLLIVFYFLVWPAWFKRGEVKAKIAAVEGQIVRLQTLRRKEKGWLQEKSDYQKFIRDVKEKLFRPGQTSLLLGKVSKLADEAGVSVIASTPRTEEKVEFPKPFDESYRAELYDFTVEGGYHQLGDFVSRLESYPKLLRVELFQISPKEEPGERHLANITLSAVSLQKDEPVTIQV